MEVEFSMKVLDNFPIVKPWNNSNQMESNAIDQQASDHPIIQPKSTTASKASDNLRLSEELSVYEGMIFVQEDFILNC